MRKHLIAAFVAAGTLTAPALSQFTIEQIAPENAIFVAGADNVQAMMDNIQRTRLWELWKSDEVKDLTGEFMDQMAHEMAQMYEQLGIEEGSLAHPQGPAGAVLYTVTDEETLMPKMAAFLYADFGDNADKFGEFMEAMLQEAADEWDTEFDVEDLLGREVTVVEKPAVEGALDDEEMDFEQDFGGGPQFMDPEKLAEQFSTMYILRDASRFLAASDPESLRTALEVIDGEAAPSVGDRDDYRAARAQIGDTDSFALLLTRDFSSLVDALDESGMVRMMVGPSMSALFGEIGAMGLGYRVDGPRAMVEQYVTMYMPNGKGGIFALLDTESPRGDLPSFAGTDAISYTTVNVEFDGVLEFVQNAIQSNPMAAMQLAEQMPMIEEYIHGIFDPLGSKVHTIQTLRRPLEADSIGTVFAIECEDPVAFENFIAEQGAMMGMEPRDFLGHRIYSMDAGMMGMMPGGGGAGFSLGLGGGHLFLGTTPGVEQALRTAGADDVASLSDDEEYRRGVAALADSPMVGWGYSNIIESMEAQVHVQRLQMEQTIQQMEEFDPEMAAEMKADMEETATFLEKLDMDMLRRYIGPSVWMIRSTDDGFVMSSYVLESDAE